MEVCRSLNALDDGTSWTSTFINELKTLTPLMEF